MDDNLFLPEGRKKKGALAASAPVVNVSYFIIASPQIQNQPRYAFPIIYAMPILIAFYKRDAYKMSDK